MEILRKDPSRWATAPNLSNYSADTAALGPDDDIRQRLDIDSMDHLNFVIGLHAATSIEIPERDYGKLTTVRAAVEYLRSRAK